METVQIVQLEVLQMLCLPSPSSSPQLTTLYLAEKLEVGTPIPKKLAPINKQIVWLKVRKCLKCVIWNLYRLCGWRFFICFFCSAIPFSLSQRLGPLHLMKDNSQIYIICLIINTQKKTVEMKYVSDGYRRFNNLLLGEFLHFLLPTFLFGFSS